MMYALPETEMHFSRLLAAALCTRIRYKHRVSILSRDKKRKKLGRSVSVRSRARRFLGFIRGKEKYAYTRMWKFRGE